MSKLSLLQEIRRIKSTTKPVSKKAIQQQQSKAMQRTLTQAYLQRQKVLSQKSVSKTSLESIPDQQQQPIVQKNYSYDKKTFYFPIRDIDLSYKRVEIFEKTIKKRQGRCLNEQQAYDTLVQYIVSSYKTSKFILNQKLERIRDGIKQKVKYSKIINFQYVIDCEKYGAVLQTQPYQLFKCSQQKICNQDFQFGESRKLVHIEQPTDDEAQEAEEAKASIMSSTTSMKKLSKTQSICIAKSVPNLVKNQQTAYKSSIKQIRPINKQLFACQKGSTESQFSVNQFIYEELMKFYSIYENEKDTGRKIAYLKAASAIKSYHKQIQSERDIMQLRGIGKKIVNKVKELLETGQIQKLSRLQENKQTLICQELTRVWGIGVSKAKQLQQKGITSLEMLKQRQDLLNKNQRIGLKYVQEFEQRIPRDKVTKMFEFIRGRFWELVGSDQLHNIQVCGSYRRGKQTCGDMDVIISRKDGTFQQKIVVDFVAKLQKQGFLTDHLSIPSKKSNENNKSISYMGVCVFESEAHHRIDIKYYSVQQFAFATLYFTGSDMFNRSMRLFARKKGYSLSDHGLTVVERTSSNQKIWKGQGISLYSERQIFDYLGLDYKSPIQRNI